MLRFKTNTTFPACWDNLPMYMSTLARSFYPGVPEPSWILASRIKYGQKSTCLSFRLNRSFLSTLIQYNFSSALSPYLSSLNLFLVQTALETVNDYNDGITAFDHLCNSIY